MADRKTASRRGKPVGIGASHSAEPRIQPVDLDAMSGGEPEELVHLFTLKGEDYYIPAEPPASAVLRYLHRVRTEGEESAGAWLLEEMIGAEGYMALMNYDKLKMSQLSAVMQAVQRHVMGATERAGGIGVPLER